MHKVFVFTALMGVALASDKLTEKLVSLQTGETANVLISFVGSNTQVIQSIEKRTFQTRTERLSTLKTLLERLAAKTQQNAISILENHGVSYKSFWISNQITVRAASKLLLKELAALPEVEEIHHQRIIHLETLDGSSDGIPQPLAEWGITKIQAEEAWAITNGTGIVVATIDTGVRGSHEAVKDSFRGGTHSWFDPYAATSSPNDQGGHGTHTMGTIVGINGIGVAPGAKWIACKGCSTTSCTDEALLGCGQWALCPTKADGTDEDCSQAPALVSNSWGGGRGDKFYEPTTEAWIAGGIIPVFSQGNSGPSCGTANSPGDVRRVIGVGSTNVRDEISYFSSIGPAADGRIKPEVSAPGENIRSSVIDSDTSYGTKSGTSMACPHVAGATALLLSVKPDLTFAQVRRILLAGVDTDLATTGQECGSISDTSFPNHVFGWGRINALKIVRAAKALE